MKDVNKRRLLSGDRPVGHLHLGHYAGNIAPRLKLQPDFENFFIIADLHMLTTKNTRADIAKLAAGARTMVLDSLAAGIDPEQTTFFLQSAIPEIGALNILCQNMISVSNLSSIPTVAAMSADVPGGVMPYGLLGYPVLQAADVLSVRPNAVPVNADNSPHAKVTPEIAQQINDHYGDVVPVPELIDAGTTPLPGIDGHPKITPARQNAIFLTDDADTVRRKVFAIPERGESVSTDPALIYHEHFNTDRAEYVELRDDHGSGKIGGALLRERLNIALNSFLDPIRERRLSEAVGPADVTELIAEGTKRAQAEAATTLSVVYDAMGLTAHQAELLGS